MCNDSSQTLDAEHTGRDPKGQNKETDIQQKNISLPAFETEVNFKHETVFLGFV